MAGHTFTSSWPFVNAIVIRSATCKTINARLNTLFSGAANHENKLCDNQKAYIVCVDVYNKGLLSKKLNKFRSPRSLVFCHLELSLHLIWESCHHGRLGTK